jgi:hypothetical protein
LDANKAKYQEDSRFTSFYRRRSESSPVKKEVGGVLSDMETAVKSVRRRATKAVEEFVAT